MPGFTTKRRTLPRGHGYRHGDDRRNTARFTRGLALIGPYALVGLSQVRESVFSELPVTETTAERNCGVWIVDTRTGETAGFVKFEGVVQEIFDLQVLPGMKWPTFIQEPSTLTTSAFVLSDIALKQVARP